VTGSGGSPPPETPGIHCESFALGVRIFISGVGMERRTKEIKIRLTDGEHQRLLERSQRTHLAEWLRELGLGERTPSKRRKLPDVDPQLFRHIAGTSNNLNQIARKLNQMQSLGAEDTIRLLSLLTSIDRQLTELLEQHRDR